MKSDKRTEVKSIVCGAATGAANGLFGGGGGMIAVPLLRAQGLEEKRAHATAIAVILPVSLLSFLLYAFRGFFGANGLFGRFPWRSAGLRAGLRGRNCFACCPKRRCFTYLRGCS